MILQKRVLLRPISVPLPKEPFYDQFAKTEVSLKARPG